MNSVSLFTEYFSYPSTNLSPDMHITEGHHHVMTHTQNLNFQVHFTLSTIRVVSGVKWTYKSMFTASQNEPVPLPEFRAPISRTTIFHVYPQFPTQMGLWNVGYTKRSQTLASTSHSARIVLCSCHIWHFWHHIKYTNTWSFSLDLRRYDLEQFRSSQNQVSFREVTLVALIQSVQWRDLQLLCQADNRPIESIHSSDGIMRWLNDSAAWNAIVAPSNGYVPKKNVFCNKNMLGISTKWRLVCSSTSCTIKCDKIPLSSTIITLVSLFGYFTHLSVDADCRSVCQLKNKYHSQIS